MANAENNTPNANANANANASFAEQLRAETEKQRANAKANYYFEIYAQTGAQTVVLRKTAQDALSVAYGFKPLARVSNKNKTLFDLYERALSETAKCIRGVDKIK